MNVKLSKAQKIKVNRSEDVYPIMQQILLREIKLRRNQEHFWVIGLNNASKILFIELVSLGAVNRVHVNPPEVFRMAIYKLATQMIMVHNHPSGRLEPSLNDRDFTNRMMKAGLMININVIDHMVISETGYTSFADMGIMEELRRNDAYRIVDVNEGELRAFKIDLEKRKAEKKTAEGIASKMLKDGQPAEMVRRYTGLTKRQVEKLIKPV